MGDLYSHQDEDHQDLFLPLSEGEEIDDRSTNRKTKNSIKVADRVTWVNRWFENKDIKEKDDKEMKETESKVKEIKENPNRGKRDTQRLS